MGAVVAFVVLAVFLTAGAACVDRWYDDIQLWIESLEERLYSRGRW